MTCCNNNCQQGTTCPARQPAALPDWLQWLRREIKARSQLLKWFRTNRAHGFSRRRSIVIAWTTTRPIHTSRKTK